MYAFRTEINISPHRFIDHRTTLITVGSCFADNLGQSLLAGKFKVLVNPFGTAYNPLSIHRLLNDSIDLRPPAPELFIEREGIWSHFDFHSRWSSPQRATLEKNLAHLLSQTNTWLRATGVIFITYGTAWIYEHQATHAVVSNCHKVPRQSFERRLLSAREIVGDFGKLYQNTRAFNPNTKFVLTLSPVRHVRDTLEGNQVSKAVIRVACEEIVSSFKDVLYFPAYEILLDDLRDYRFYDADLIHPSEVAQEYIWEKFKACYLTDAATALVARWQLIKKALEHRPFQPGSDAHRKFVTDTLARLKEISDELDVSEEVKAFSKANQN